MTSMVMTTVHGKPKVHGKNDAWAIDFSLVKCEIDKRINFGACSIVKWIRKHDVTDTMLYAIEEVVSSTTL